MPGDRGANSFDAPESCRRMEVRQDLDVFLARVAVRDVAHRLGFSVRQAEELALVVTELCTNVLKHSGHGSLEIVELRDREFGPGVRMVARDVGPPIADFAMASMDGFNDLGPLDPTLRGRGIGAGLGSILRLSDHVGHAVEDGGNVVTASRYLVRPRRCAS